jgi:hypothetical protein
MSHTVLGATSELAEQEIQSAIPIVNILKNLGMTVTFVTQSRPPPNSGFTHDVRLHGLTSEVRTSFSFVEWMAVPRNTGGMYTVEQYARVRQAVLIAGKSQRMVAGSLAWRDRRRGRCWNIRRRLVISVGSRNNSQAGAPKSSEYWSNNFVAMDVDSELVISHLVGKLDASSTYYFIRDFENES